MAGTKYGRYHAGAEYSGALLFPFCLDANGSFIPTDRLYNPGVDGRQAPLGKGLAPQAGLRAVFEDGKSSLLIAFCHPLRLRFRPFAGMSNVTPGFTSRLA